MKQPKRWGLPVVLVFLALVLAGCGGGSGTGASTTAGTGNVAILITDDPTQVYTEIYVTITEISLIPREEAADSQPSILFEGEETLDLLQLRDYAELFTVAEGVAVQDYEKVRLSVSSVVLIDSLADPPLAVEAKLPGGKIDLVPDGPLAVTEDSTLYLEIDIDARNSVLIVEAGTGELIFRPVAFVRTYEEAAPDLDNGDAAPDEDETESADDGPLISVSGLLRVDPSDRLLVCPSDQAAQMACVRLRLEDDSAVFDSTGAVVGTEALVVGARLIAMGMLARDPDDGRRVLDVLSAVLGTRPTIGTRGGTAAGAVDEEGLFVLRNDRSVALVPETPVVNPAGTRLGPDAIVDGQGMTIMGVVGADPLAATLVVLRGDRNGAEDEGQGEPLDGEAGAPVTALQGELVSVEEGGVLQVEVEGATRWVRLADDGMLVISGRGSVGSGALEQLADLARARIMAHGSEGESYFEARQIVAITLGRDDMVMDGGPDRGGPPMDGGPDRGGPPVQAGPPGRQR